MSSASFEAALQQLAASGGKPPVHLWHPAHVGEMDLRILADGRWVHEGKAIERPALVRLFASVMRLDNDGYCLVTPVEKQRITVVDAPFQAVELQVDHTAEGPVVRLRTNVDDIVTVDDRHPLWLAGEGGQIPYVMVRDGLHARIGRSVYYQLLEAAEVEQGRCFLLSRGRRFILGESG